MTFQGGDIAPGRRPGQRRCRAELSDIGQRGACQAHEGVEVEPGRRRHPLHLAHEAHEVVGGYARRSVVGGAVLVVDDHDQSAEEAGQPGREGVAGDGEGDPATKSNPADLGRRQGHERVQRRPSGMGGQHVEAEGPRQVHHHRVGHGHDTGGDPGDRRVGRGDHEHVDAPGSLGQVVGAPQGLPDVAADIGEGRSQ